MVHWDSFADERDHALLLQEKGTFFVLQKILHNCQVLLTDHARTIICYSQAPYPVWIWTANDANAQEMELIYRTLKQHGLFEGHSFNLKPNVTEFFIQRAAADGVELAVKKNISVYNCPKPVAPTKMADGQLCKCVRENIPQMVDFMVDFHQELGDSTDRNMYRAEVESAVNEGRIFFWQNEGENVACCYVRYDGNLASVSMVYTCPQHRRHHYAQSMVYMVTKNVADAGYTPMLYADADYVPSNACYQTLGYTLCGRLCTIG